MVEGVIVFVVKKVVEKLVGTAAVTVEVEVILLVEVVGVGEGEVTEEVVLCK